MSGTLEIRTHALTGGEGLAAALLGDEGVAGELLPTRPSTASGPARSGGRPAARLPPEAFGTTGSEASARLERILAGEGTLVSTGQQPLLFLGPLYVLYKAISALELARRLETETGRPALALFWVASDDHDWAEVGRTRIVDTENRLQELRLAPPAGWEGRPAGVAPLPDRVSELIEQMFQFLPNTDFVQAYLELFQGTWRPGRSLGEAFGRSLAGLLPGRPLAWLDAGSGALKRAAAPLLESALRNAGDAAEALESGGGKISALGHEAPLPVLAGATDVFYDTGAERARLYREENRVRAGREGPERTLEETLAELEDAPERFGPNVALRPVLESWLLPVGATVLGPGELAYWSQLPDLFALHEVPMPAVHPRHGWLLVEAKVTKVLEKLDEEPEAFADRGEEVARRAVRDARPAELERALEELRGGLGRALDEVETAVVEHLPGIRSAVGKARSQAFAVARELEDQVDARLRERREVVLEQIRKAALHLYPDGAPQERVQSPFYYLARYGTGLLDALEERSRQATPPLWPAA